MDKTCKTCQYFNQMDDEPTGVCSFLSDFDFESESGAGAEGEFFCTPEWGCASHSDNDRPAPEDMPDGSPEGNQAPEPPAPSERRRASDYLNP